MSGAISDQRAKVQAYIEQTAEDRSRSQGRLFRESDFFAGAMSVFYALGCQADIPPLWVFSFLSGTTPLKELAKAREVQS